MISPLAPISRPDTGVSLVHWVKKHIINLPPKAKPPLHNCVANSKSITERGDAIRHPAHRENSVARLVSCLLFHRCPPAIFLKISKVIVDSVEGCFFRLLSHIKQKIIKNLPSVTNRNTSPSVILESDLVRVEASSKHSIPCAIRGCLLLSSSMSVRCASSFCQRDLEATA